MDDAFAVAGDSQTIKIDAVRQGSVRKREALDARRQRLIDQCFYSLASDVIEIKQYLGRLGQIKLDGRGRIEQIGIEQVTILADAEQLAF